MIKLNPPTEVKITVLPDVDIPNYDAWERLPKFAWRDLVSRTRLIVGSALNQFFYTDAQHVRVPGGK
jgi:hypothetical protein